MRKSSEISQELAGKVQELQAASDASARKNVAEEVKALTAELSQSRAAEAAELALAMDKPEEKEVRRYSLSKAIRQAASHSLDGFELEMDQEAHREFSRMGQQIEGFGIPSAVLRAISAQNVSESGKGDAFRTTQEGGYLEALQDALLGSRLGVQYLDGLVGNLHFPKGGKFNAQWLAEGVKATKQVASFESILMSPHGLQVLAGYTKDLLNSSSYAVENIVWNALIKAHAQALDSAIFNGTGASGQPKGIIGTTGVNTVAIGGALDFAKLVNLETVIAEKNALTDNVKFAMNASINGMLKTTPQQKGYPTYLVAGGQANGYPVNVSNVIPAGTAILGDFSNVVVGQWGGLDIIVDPYTAKDSRIIEVSAVAYHDVAVLYPEAFAVATGITAGA